MESVAGHMSDLKCLMVAISKSDHMAIGWIIQTALQHGAGVHTIIDRIACAQKGLFKPHSYSVSESLSLAHFTN